jgi:hypothetical protein
MRDCHDHAFSVGFMGSKWTKSGPTRYVGSPLWAVSVQNLLLLLYDVSLLLAILAAGSAAADFLTVE